MIGRRSRRVKTGIAHCAIPVSLGRVEVVLEGQVQGHLYLTWCADGVLHDTQAGRR